MHSSMPVAGIKPSARTLTGLTFAIGRIEGGADIQPAFATLDFLRQHKIPSDRVFYTSLLHACAAARGGADLDSAHSILFIMESDGLRPDLHTYTELLAACAWAKDGGQPDQAELVMSRIGRDGLIPDIRSYNLLLEAYARRPRGQGSAESAMEVLQRMEVAGVQVSCASTFEPLDWARCSNFVRLQPTEKTFELLLAAVLGSARRTTYERHDSTAPTNTRFSLREWLKRLVGIADDANSSEVLRTSDASALSVESQWRNVLEVMEDTLQRHSKRHTGRVTRVLLDTLAQHAEAEHVLPVLEEMATNRGKGGVLGGKLGPSAVAAVLEACARAAEQRRPLHKSLKVWPPSKPLSKPTAHEHGNDRTYDAMQKDRKCKSADLANHAQVAIRIAEAASHDGRYGEAAARLSPLALEWLVVACLHDTAAVAQKMTPATEQSPRSLRHVQYATLSRGIALVESLQRRLPKKWTSHHEDHRSDVITSGTVGTSGSYAERLRWAVRTLCLLNSLCGSGSASGSALASILRDDIKSEHSENEDELHDGSAPASMLLAALIRSCTQSQLAVDGDVILKMSEAAYTAAIAVNKDAANVPDVFTAMIEAYAHVPQQATENQLLPHGEDQGAQQAFRILDTMRSMKVCPTLATFNALMSVCTAYSDKNLALSTYDMMRYHQIEPDHTTFVYLIRACGADAITAQQIFDRQFAATGLTPSAAVFEALAQTYAADGKLDKAVATLQDLEQTPGMLSTDACHDAVLLGAAASLQDTSAAVLQQCATANEKALAVQERAVEIAVDTLECMHYEGRRPGGPSIANFIPLLTDYVHTLAGNCRFTSRF
eukprot:COSAG02_NODE_173_length_31245_cov_413.548096_20_plen_831_part_00